MSTHPNHTALFESARAARPTAEVSAHLDGCAACREKFRRLRAGSALMTEAGSVTPEIDWSRMDDVLAVEADKAARAVRLAPKPSNRWAFFSATGLTLAAAAGVLLWVRGHSAESASTGPTTALVSPSQTPESLAPHRAPTSRVTASRGEVSTHADALDDGAVLTTGMDGNATVALNGNWQMEIRPSSEVEFDHVNDPSAITLQRGELSVQPSSAEHHDLSLHARRWTVSSDGALVARAELNRVRMTVLSGRVNTRSGAVSASYTGPIELALPDSGDRAEVLGQTHAPTIAAAAPRQVAPTTARVIAPAETAPAALNVIPSGVREADDLEQRYLRAQARTGLENALSACREQETCTGPVTITVLVDETGRVTRSRAEGNLQSDARTSLERNARGMAISPPPTPFRFSFTVNE